MGSKSFSLLAVTISFAGIIGVFVGSFLNVVVYRAPLGLSISSPRSFCPACGRQLKWWENIPLASWIGLRGRCRTCSVPISVRYPGVELSTGVLFALVTWAWAGTIVSAAYCALVASMVAVSLIEYGGKRAPLSVAAIGTGIAELTIVVGAGWHHYWHIVIGSLVGSLIAAGIYAILRATDPECTDPRGHGRSALLIAGCWVGGLGFGPAAVGGGFWIATYFICLVGIWALNREYVGPSVARKPVGSVPPVFATPLVSAIALALAASLIAGG
jgi:prepilin signal peptidase PulO-like enzyme (type II secretory pathway)